MPREHIALVRECFLKLVLLLLCPHLMSSVSWQLQALLSASFIQRNVSHWSCQHSSSTVATTTLLTVCDERRWWLLMMLRRVVLETVHHIWSECTWLITGASSVSVSAAVCASTGYFPVPSFFHPLVTYLCLVFMISHYIILSLCITVLISCRRSMFDRLIGIDCPRWSIDDRFPVSSCFSKNQWYPHLLLIYCLPPRDIFSAVLFPFEEEVVISFADLVYFRIALRFVFAFSPPNLSKCLFEFIFLVWKSRPFSTTRLLLLLLSSLTGMCVFSLREVGKLAHWLIDWAQW